jgi:assimilatory nitrate reductase catalytic subunit
VAEALGFPEDIITREPSLAYDQILEGVLSGKIRGLWIVATNPSHSWINQLDAREILSRLDFLVVQDMYTTTETAVQADLLLPAAGWGEKEGTFINSERRIGLAKKVARAPGQALADFHIFRLVAEAWGCGDLFKEWTSPEAVFHIMKRVTEGQPCDISGITDYAMLDQAGGVQWPFPVGSDFGAEGTTERRLFADGQFFHPDRKAKLLFEAERPLPEPTNAEYPLTLLTGRGTSSQWHTQTRTKKSAVLRRLAPQRLYLEISPVDALARGISPEDEIMVSSRRARIPARAFVTNTVQPGQVFLPMHEDSVNRLTFAAFDPYSRQPSYKACAVEVRTAKDDL